MVNCWKYIHADADCVRLLSVNGTARFHLSTTSLPPGRPACLQETRTGRFSGRRRAHVSSNHPERLEARVDDSSMVQNSEPLYGSHVCELSSTDLLAAKEKCLESKPEDVEIWHHSSLRPPEGPRQLGNPPVCFQLSVTTELISVSTCLNFVQKSWKTSLRILRADSLAVSTLSAAKDLGSSSYCLQISLKAIVKVMLNSQMTNMWSIVILVSPRREFPR